MVMVKMTMTTKTMMMMTMRMIMMKLMPTVVFHTGCMRQLWNSVQVWQMFS